MRGGAFWAGSLLSAFGWAMVMVWLAVSVVGHDPVEDGVDLCGIQGSVKNREAVYGSADEQVG